MSRVVNVRVYWQDRNGPYATLRWSKEGERDWEVLGYVTVEQAEILRAEKEVAIRRGLPSIDSGKTGPVGVSRLIEEYLRVLEEDARGSAAYRQHEILHALRLDRHLGRLAAHRVTEHHLRKMVADLMAEEPEVPKDPRERRHRSRGIGKRSSILDLLGCLRRIYRAGRDAGLTDAQPPATPRNMLPDDSRAPRQITEDEVARLGAAGRTMWAAFGRLLLFLAWCPRRMIAVFALTRADCARVLDPTIRRKDIKINIRRDKAGRGRGLCPLTEPALLVLREQLESMEDKSADALVWTSSTGRPYSSSLIAEPFRRAVAAAGIEDTNPYDLRKFGAVAVYARCMDLHVTAEYTGHEDVATLLARYLSAPKGRADEMASRITWSPPALRAVEDEDGDPS